jgi:hypothetical protein
MKVNNQLPNQSMKNQPVLSPMKNLSILPSSGGPSGGGPSGATGEAKNAPTITVYKFGKALSVKASDITCLEGVGNYTSPLKPAILLVWKASEITHLCIPGMKNTWFRNV